MNILANLRSAFASNRRRNVIVASVAALVVAGVVGRATAVTLTIDLPRTYKSLVDIVAINTAGIKLLHFVDAGSKVLITDIVISNTTTSSLSAQIFASDASDCFNRIKDATSIIMIPPQDTVDLTLTTGIFFGGGQYICIAAVGPNAVMARGFVFT